MKTLIKTSAACLLASTVTADVFVGDAVQQQVLAADAQKRMEHLKWKETIRTKLMHSSEFNDQIKLETLTPKFGVHLMYDDVLLLVEQLKKEFPGIVKVSSAGKTYEGRDIPLITLEMGPKPHEERSSILYTGAHHAREALSIQMPFYIIMKMLHAALHGDEKYIEMLSEHSFHFMPVINLDGLNYITEAHMQTNEYPMKRKNMNQSYGGQWLCGDEEHVGVDLNRNYGFSFGQHGLTEMVCSEMYSGPKPFSEPETRAVRDFVIKESDRLKFVYNFHTYGNSFLKPFFGIDGNVAKENFGWHEELYDEIIANGHPPSDETVGSVHDNLGYTSPGEASDWIVAAFNIPTISPEIGSYMSFFPNVPEAVTESCDGFYPIAEYTMELLTPKMTFEPEGAIKQLGGNNFKFSLKMANGGLSDMKLDTIVKGFKSKDAKILSANVKDGFGSSIMQGDALLFTPVFARDSVSIEFIGQWLGDVPEHLDLTIEKVQGDKAVPQETRLSLPTSSPRFMAFSLESIAEVNDQYLYITAVCLVLGVMATLAICAYKNNRQSSFRPKVEVHSDASNPMAEPMVETFSGEAEF